MKAGIYFSYADAIIADDLRLGLWKEVASVWIGLVINMTPPHSTGPTENSGIFCMSGCLGSLNFYIGDECLSEKL